MTTKRSTNKKKWGILILALKSNKSKYFNRTKGMARKKNYRKKNDLRISNNEEKREMIKLI